MAAVPSPATISCAIQPLVLPRAHPLSPPSTVRQNTQQSRQLLAGGGERPPQSSYSSLILGKTKRQEFFQAFELFGELLASGWSPDEFALGSLLKASASLSDVRLGEQLHAKCIRAGHAAERGVRTSLIAMYSNGGLLGEGRRVFDEVPPADETDVPTWNSIISAYAFHGWHDECFALFCAMLEVARLTPTHATYAIVTSACSASKAAGIGKMIHTMIVKDRACDQTKAHNALISMYAKCGLLHDAEKVFEAMRDRDIISWNAMISGLEQNDHCEEAIQLFHRLNGLEGQISVKPNRITFLGVLSAVATILALKLGKEIHAHLIRLGLENETSVGNSLITMYGKCGEAEKASLAFQILPSQDVISWNSMLSCYAQGDNPEHCFELFQEMQMSGLRPSLQTLTILLCGLSSEFSSCSSRLGREIHGYLLKREVAKTVHVSVYNAIITMYSKVDRLGDAMRIFKTMSLRDSCTWNAMMDGYSVNERFDDAMMLFYEMHAEGFPPDHMTFSIIFTVCSKLVSIELGRQLHAFSVKQCLQVAYSKPLLLSVNNALISMYSKCGNINDAADVFERMEKRDVFSWTALITGYAHHGMAYESIQLFEAMRASGTPSNSITFLGLLSACAHAGLTEAGIHYFDLMSKGSNTPPSIEHYACMVDLFGRSGHLEKAEAMVHTAISHLELNGSSCLWLWKVLLGACHTHKQLDLGVQAARRILELDPDDDTTHVLLSNLYAAFGLWKDAVAVRKLMTEKGLKKEAGCSWVEIANRKHIFVAGDSCHESRKQIYENLEILNEKCVSIGYVPMTEYALHDVDEAQKEAILSCHSERLAVSFALLHPSKKRRVIRVFKNLRVCGDCHSWMKYASKIEACEIILRDSRRFHTFSEGKCSCGDYW